MRKWFKQLICRHSWHDDGRVWFPGIKTMVVYAKCSKCGKITSTNTSPASSE